MAKLPIKPTRVRKTPKDKSLTELADELADKKAELKFVRQSRNYLGIISVINNIIRFGSLVSIFYIIYLSIAALAGKETLANIGLNVLANIRISEAVAWLFAGSSLLYGLNERRVRKKSIEHLQPRNIQLEQLLDANRTSSSLTKRGDTNPVDDFN